MKNISKIFVVIIVLTALTQNLFSQKKAADQKSQLVSELVEISFPVFPTVSFEGDLKNNNQELLLSFKDQISESLNAKLDSNERFSAEKKAEIRAKLPALIDKIGARLSSVVTQDLNIPQWIKESLAQNYSRKFTVSELKTLNDFFKGAKGKAFLEMVREEADAKTVNRPSKSKELIEEKDAAEIEAFLKKPVAVKFMNIFTLESDKFLDDKIDNWAKTTLKNVEAEVKGGEIHKMMAAFIEENK